MKRLLSVLSLFVVLVSGVFAGGTKAKGIEIDMFISMPEYADAVRALIAEYKKIAPDVTIIYESVQDAYPAMLEARLNSGNVPDIFASTAGAEIDLYRAYSLNLAGMPVANALLPAVANDFKSLSDGSGPYAFGVKGNYFGMLYNKDIFEKAGITEFPRTLDALEAACKKIAAVGAKPFTSGFGEWWVFKHMAMPFFATASADPVAMVKKFEKGQAKISDYPRLYNDLFRFVDLVKQYGDDKPLETTLDREIAAFANGQAAMTVGQGPWIEEDTLKINPRLRIGFAGYPVSNNPADCKVVSGTDIGLRVSNKSKNQKAVLDFVNWWNTSDYGKKWFGEIAKVVPPISGATMPNLEVPKQGAVLAAKDGDLPCTINYSTNAFHIVFGEAIQGYVGGISTKDQTCAQIERQWVMSDGSN